MTVWEDPVPLFPKKGKGKESSKQGSLIVLKSVSESRRRSPTSVAK